MMRGSPGRVWHRCVGLMLVLALSLLTRTEADAVGSTTAGQAQAAVPLAEIGLRAQAAMRQLREVEIRLRPSLQLTDLAATLPAFHERTQARLAETSRSIESPTQLRIFSVELERWLVLRQETDTWTNLLKQRATDLEESTAAVESLRDTWTAARSAASTADAPADVSDRIGRVLAQIRAVREQIVKAEETLFALEDRVAQEREVCDGALARIEAARGGFLDRLFVPDRPPLWRSVAGPTPSSAQGAGVADSARRAFSDFRRYVLEYRRRLLGEFFAFAVLALLLRRIRAQARRWIAQDDSLAATMRVIERPYSCALFTVALMSQVTDPLAPQALRAIHAFIGLAPATLLLPSVLPPVLRRALLALVVLALIQPGLGLVADAPLSDQRTFVLVMLLATAICVWFLRRQREADKQAGAGGTVEGSRYRNAAVLLGALAVASLLAGALGYMALARLVTMLCFGGLIFAVLLFVLMRIAEALLAYALRVRPLCLLRTVEEHRPAIQLRVRRTLAGLAVIIWVFGILQIAALLKPLGTIVVDVVGTRLTVGAFSISLGDVVSVVVTVWLALRLSAFIRLLLAEDVFPRVHMARGASTALPSLIHYVILTAAFIVSLAMLGVDLTHITILASAFGVGIGFGLQDVVNNFAAGLILLVERPIQVGDLVQIGNLVAQVQRIGIRSSLVRTGDGAEVIVPNSKLVANEVTNWTLSDRTRRIDVPVVVAYGTDPERVLRVLREVVAEHPSVLQKPAPSVLLVGFGDRGLNFNLGVWVGVFERWPTVRSEVALAVHEALAREGIQVPGSERDVALVEPSSADPAVQRTRGGG